MVHKHGLTFPVLNDPGNRVAAQYGLVHRLPPDLQQVYAGWGIDLPRFNGDDSWSLPLPGRVVVDQAGIIRDVEVHTDHTERPEPAATLALVRTLAGT